MLPTQRLAELVRTKHQVLMQLHEVGQRQARLVSDGDIAALLNLLGSKQKLIGDLQEVERDLKPFYAEDPDGRTWPSPQERAACAQQVAQCNALLEKIVQLEKSGTEQITMRRNDVAEQLRQVHTAAHVRNAYESQRTSRAL